MLVKEKEVYGNMYFVINDLIKKIDEVYWRTGIYSKELNIFYITILDLSIFSEKKSNLGLFNLKKYLNIHLFFNGVDIKTMKIVIKNLKMSII